MIEEKQWISSKILFSAISEQLADNRQAVFTVTGMSMWPFLCHGRDQVIIEAIDPKNLKIGDIILFRVSEERYILHRITCCKKDYFETTGDGNLFRDGKFPYICIVGRIKKVIRKEKVIDCDSFLWRLLSRIWMLFFPFRKWIINTWLHIRKYIR